MYDIHSFTNEYLLESLTGHIKGMTMVDTVVDIGPNLLQGIILTS